MRITTVGGPTALVELGAARLLVDPTFDPPGEHPIGSRALTKTAGPALAPEALGRVDAVLLSHDQHPDNLDDAGRALLADAPLVLSTAAAAERIPGVRALPDGESVEVAGVRVTGVPAQHGPDGSEAVVGPVTGFVLTGPAAAPITVYVSGDNASLDVVRGVAARFGPVDVAVLFAGAARSPAVDGALTLTSEMAAEAAQLLGARRVVVVHTDQWAHFTEGPETVGPAFAAAGIGDRLRVPVPGEPLDVLDQDGD